MKRDHIGDLNMYNFTSDLGLTSYEEVFKDAANDKHSLLMITGGLDSAYLLWKYSQYTDYIVCHHVNILKNGYSARRESENIAIKQQIDYLTQQGKNVKLLTSTIDINYHKEGIRDLYSVIISSMHYALYEKCHHIVTGDDFIDAYDREQSYSSLEDKYRDELKLINDFVKSYTNNFCSISVAHDASNVAELYSEMPDDYCSLIFSCREPIYKVDRIESCCNCLTCIKNKYFGWRHRMSNCIRI